MVWNDRVPIKRGLSWRRGTARKTGRLVSRRVHMSSSRGTMVCSSTSMNASKVQEKSPHRRQTRALHASPRDTRRAAAAPRPPRAAAALPCSTRDAACTNRPTDCRGRGRHRAVRHEVTAGGKCERQGPGGRAAGGGGHAPCGSGAAGGIGEGGGRGVSHGLARPRPAGRRRCVHGRRVLHDGSETSDLKTFGERNL